MTNFASRNTDNYSDMSDLNMNVRKTKNAILTCMAGMVCCVWLISCSDKNEKRLQLKINQLKSIGVNDMNELDTLFYQFNAQRYPLDADCRNQTVLLRKIDYIKTVSKNRTVPLTKIQYQAILDSCNAMSPDLVNIFLDTSASMNGYLNHTDNNDFIKVVTSLNISGYGGRDNIDCYFYGNRLSEKKDYVSFSLALSRRGVATGSSSKLDDMYAEIISLSRQNTVSFFVTDAIIAGDDKELQRLTPQELNSYYQTSLENITYLIRTAKSKDKNFAISIYRFIGKFTGTYYKYNNKQSEFMQGQERPFFVFVLGDRKIVNDFREKVKKKNEIPNFQPVQQIHFDGVADPAFKFESDQIGRENKMKDSAKKGKGAVTIKVTLSNFPNYVLDAAYLRNHCTAGITGYGTIVPASIRNSNFTLEFPDNALQSQNEITVRMEMNHLPDWCSEFSTDNDTDIGACLDQTFYLRQLTAAIRDGMISKNNVEGKYRFTK